MCNSGPDIWLEYTQYSIGGMGSPGGIEKVRAIFERAMTAVGLHMTKGQMLWEAYREFENAILFTKQVCLFMFKELMQDGHILDKKNLLLDCMSNNNIVLIDWLINLNANLLTLPQTKCKKYFRR